MINCNECTHFHDLGTKLFCDAGIMEVQIIGGAVCVAQMTQCDRFEFNGHEIYDSSLAPDEILTKIDKRSKEYRERTKNA